MAQTLSEVSAETKLKVANLLTAAFAIWKPGPRYLPDVIYELAPDIQTRDAAILTLNAFAQAEDFECWEHYESMLKYVHLEAPTALGLRIINVLTRTAF